MAHHHNILSQMLLTISLLVLIIQAEYSEQREYRLPLPAARNIRSQSNDQLEPVQDPQYHFKYSVNDKETGDFKSQEETRDGKSVFGRYTVAEPTGHIREVKYSADAKSGFKADVKIHPPALFDTKNSEKRSAEGLRNQEKKGVGSARLTVRSDDQVEENQLKQENEEKVEEVQNDKSNEQIEEEQHVEETKTSNEVVHDKPQIPEEMTDEEMEKTAQNQEHILNTQEHEHSNTDEEKSADAKPNEASDNLIITVNAEKRVPAVHKEQIKTDNPVHISHAVKDPISQPAYPYIPQFYNPFPYAPHISNHLSLADNQFKNVAPMSYVPQPNHAAPLLPTFIYRDQPIQPVSPLFIQQPSNQAHHFLPGNFQDILAAKQNNIYENRPSYQDVEHMVRHNSQESRPVHDERNVQQESFQIHPKPMMFQLADPPMHVLVPDQSFKNYIAPNYHYNAPLYFPTPDGPGKTFVPQQGFDNRNQVEIGEAGKSVIGNYIKPIVNNINNFRPFASSTASPLNQEQVSSTAQPEAQHLENNQNKGQTPAPSTAPASNFNFPFLYPITSFFQRPFFQQPFQPFQQLHPQQQSVQQEDPQKVQKPESQASIAEQPMSVAQQVEQPQQVPVAQAAPAEQQRYYFLQPSMQPNNQLRFNPVPAPVQFAQKQPFKPIQVRSQSPPMQAPAPVPIHHSPIAERSSPYPFPYNSPVALLVLPMQSDQPSPNIEKQRQSNDKGQQKIFYDNYYKK